MVLSVRRGPRWLAVVMFGYVWLYDGFALLAGMVLCFFAAELITERRANWRLLAWGLGGMAAGVVINPYFPRNIASYGFNLVRTLSGAQVEARTGSEWLPLAPMFLFKTAAGTWLAFVGAMGLMAVRRRPSRATLALAVASVLGMLLAIKARRHFDLWCPVTFLFLAWSWADFWQARKTAGEDGAVKPRAGAPLIATACLGLLILNAGVVVHWMRADLKNERPFEYYKGAAEYILREVRLSADSRPPGARPIVFTGDWDDFPFMFFFNSECYYVVGLDKLYLKRYDEDLYKLWLKITAGKVKSPSKPIRDPFNAQYLVVSRHAKKATQKEKFLRLLAEADPHMKRVYKDDYCEVFRVLPP